MCTIDDQEIGTDPYFSWNNQIYCERHYNELFSPQCAKCGVGTQIPIGNGRLLIVDGIKGYF